MKCLFEIGILLRVLPGIGILGLVLKVLLKRTLDFDFCTDSLKY